MKRLLLALAVALAAVGTAYAQPRVPVTISPTTGQQGALPTATALQVRAATTANASLNVPHGTAPTSPNNGDFWSTTAGFYGRVNGATSGPFVGSGGTVTGTALNCAYFDASGVLRGTGTACGSGGGGGGTVTSVAAGNGVNFSTITLTGTVLAAIEPPQGRLTLTSNTPVQVVDVTAATTIYYAPYVGSSVPIYDGSNTQPQTFSQLSMALDSTNQPASQMFDLFDWNNSGTISIGAGPAWTTTATITVTIATPAVVTWTGHALPEGAPVIFTTSGALPTGITAGTIYFVGRSPAANTFNISTSIANAAAGTFVATSGSQSGTQTGTNHTTVRGTGAGTTELELKNGVWANKNAITLTNGAGAGTSVPADQATYVGTFSTTPTAGQTALQLQPAAAAGGANTFVGYWNTYNRVRAGPTSQDNTAGWTYATATVRAADNSVANRITYVMGLAQSFAGGTYQTTINNSNTCSAPSFGIEQDATNAAMFAPVYWESCGFGLGSANALFRPLPAIGLHYLQAVESGATNATYGSIGKSTVTADLEFIVANDNAACGPPRRRAC